MIHVSAGLAPKAQESKGAETPKTTKTNKAGAPFA